MTTPKQAYNFLPENSERKLVLRLPVNQIREIEVSFGEGNTRSNLLDVIWVFLFEDAEQTIRDNRPGAEGHSGIIGLDRDSVSNKLIRKALRSELAALASQDYHLLESLDDSNTP